VVVPERRRGGAGAGRAAAPAERAGWRAAPPSPLSPISLPLAGRTGGPRRRSGAGGVTGAGRVAAPAGRTRERSARAAAAAAHAAAAVALLVWGRNPNGFGCGFKSKPDPFTPKPDPLKVNCILAPIIT